MIQSRIDILTAFGMTNIPSVVTRQTDPYYRTNR